jgi:hypothetical protein
MQKPFNEGDRVKYIGKGDILTKNNIYTVDHSSYLYVTLKEVDWVHYTKDFELVPIDNEKRPFEKIGENLIPKTSYDENQISEDLDKLAEDLTEDDIEDIDGYDDYVGLSGQYTSSVEIKEPVPNGRYDLKTKDLVIIGNDTSTIYKIDHFEIDDGEIMAYLKPKFYSNIIVPVKDLSLVESYSINLGTLEYSDVVLAKPKRRPIADYFEEIFDKFSTEEIIDFIENVESKNEKLQMLREAYGELNKKVAEKWYKKGIDDIYAAFINDVYVYKRNFEDVWEIENDSEEEENE